MSAARLAPGPQAVEPAGAVDTTPRLTLLGRRVLVTAILLLLVSAAAGAPTLTATGALLLGLLTAALVGARQAARAARHLEIDLAEGGGGPVRGAPWSLEIHLRNRQHRAIGELHLRLLAAGEPTPEVQLRCLAVPARAEADVALEMRFPRAGHWRTLGFELTLLGPLGLAAAHQYRPMERTLTVRPRPLPGQLLSQVVAPVQALLDPEGRHRSRRAGSGLELLELRDYVPGDPLKAIAWKATARRQRPIVRDFEQETVRRLQLLLDIGPTMRAGALGQTPLDQAIDLCAALIDANPRDRLGLTTFDQRVYGHLRPERGRLHRQRLRQHLMSLSSVVDGDLTEITDAELLARVGLFLEQQEGVPVRSHAEDAARPRIARTLADPLGELFDEAAVFAIVTDRLAQDRARGHAHLFAKSRPAEDLLAARLRLFCALRGIPLPYRLSGPRDAKETGLVAAVSQCLVSGGPDTLVVVSDLVDLASGGPAVRALRLARARKRSVLLIDCGAGPLDPALGRAISPRSRIFSLAGQGRPEAASRYGSTR